MFEAGFERQPLFRPKGRVILWVDGPALSRATVEAVDLIKRWSDTDKLNAALVIISLPHRRVADTEIRRDVISYWTPSFGVLRVSLR
jgi:hypothetical protein